jgi:aryl-alcohol dehydrogenase-like predicted oxidoreductase
VKYGTVQGVTKKISRVVLGTMIINQKDDAEYTKSAKLLDDALALGVTTLDSAIVYYGGDSERAIGRWMQERGNREQVVVLTKGCIPSADRRRVTPYDMMSDISESLARLRTSYIDIWMLHRDDPAVPAGEIVEWLNEHHRAGRVRAFGGSNWTAERIAEANAYAQKKGLIGFAASSPNYGLAEQVQDPWGPGCTTVSGPQNAAARAWYQQSRLPIFAYSSLGRGFLSGRVASASYEQDIAQLDGAARTAYCHEVNRRRLERCEQLAKAKGMTVPQIATAWLMAQPLEVHALVGAANRDELASTIAGSELRLTPEEEAWLDLRAERPKALAAK